VPKASEESPQLPLSPHALLFILMSIHCANDPKQARFFQSRSKRQRTTRENNTRIPILSENEHSRIVGHLFLNSLHNFTCPRHPKKALNSLYHLMFFFPLPDLYLAQTTQNEHDFFSIAQIRQEIACENAKIAIFFNCSH
jgi:hypothetical protein